MMTTGDRAEDYFYSLLETDANSPVSKFQQKYSMGDLFRFAESYHRWMKLKEEKKTKLKTSNDGCSK